MNVEKKPIESMSTNKEGIIGYIRLDKLAIPETVKVTLLGEPLIPNSFNSWGHPIFTEEQNMLYEFKNWELERQSGGNYTPLEATIIYEERTFNVPRRTFDTIRGIKKSLRNLSSLNKLLRNRSSFCYSHKEEKLNEFILFGCIYLSKSGTAELVDEKANGKLETRGDVEDYKAFLMNNDKNYIICKSNRYVIPVSGLSCPCCSKLFTIDDIKNNPCIVNYKNDKIYHDSCLRNYERLTEVDKLTRQLMNFVYNKVDYTFELLPNGYHPDMDCYSHIPWILFHTIDGAIIMGWRKHVMSIEWQENYKPFDMNELFSTENVTKWEKGGKRGIHAHSKRKAYEYLIKVLKTVNPGYSFNRRSN